MDGLVMSVRRMCPSPRSGLGVPIPVLSWLTPSLGQSIMISLALSSLVFAMTAVLPKVMQHKIKNIGRILFEVFISLFSNNVSVSFETWFIRAFRLMTSRIMLDVLSRSQHEHCFQ